MFSTKGISQRSSRPDHTQRIAQIEPRASSQMLVRDEVAVMMALAKDGVFEQDLGEEVEGLIP